MRDFREALAQARREVDGVLAELLADTADSQSGLLAAMRYAVLGGGKRLRPFFVLEGAGICGASRSGAVRVGVAVELVHGYSLVHDDLPAMDDDDMRRGQPTVHRRYDEATAILVGDACQALAFEVLADPATHPDGAVRVELVGALARAAGPRGMAEGQMLDLSGA
ncbi:MAG: polyprenyl synthetase family protein, partial [Alphaproteobacteria bacterium]